MMKNEENVQKVIGRLILGWSLVSLLGACASTGDPPDEYTAEYQLAIQDFESKNYLSARDRFHKLLNQYPNHPFNQNTRLRLAGCEFKLGEEEEARESYQEIIVGASDDSFKVVALEAIGRIDLDAGKYLAAAENFKEALALEKKDPERDQLRLLFAMALQMEGQFKEARSLFDQLLRNSPDSKAAQDARARLKLPEYFTVQVGAFGSKENAEKQAQILRAGNFDTTVERAADRPIHYVRVGRFATRLQAIELRDRILAAKILPNDTHPRVIP